MLGTALAALVFFAALQILLVVTVADRLTDRADGRRAGGTDARQASGHRAQPA